MRGKLMFIGGLAAGFVLGARAGREKYEEIMVNAKKVLDHPTVQEAAGVAQAQANRLVTEGKEKLSHSKIGEKLTTGTGTDTTSTDEALAGSATTTTTTYPATGTTTSGTTY
jgi:hypothetical protein